MARLCSEFHICIHGEPKNKLFAFYATNRGLPTSCTTTAKSIINSTYLIHICLTIFSMVIHSLGQAPHMNTTGDYWRKIIYS